MTTPGNPVVGATVLRIPAIQSPNFSLAGETGWAIFQNGDAYFFNVTAEGTITATTFDGTDFVINSAGAFFYSGTPAAGNLIISIAPSAGTDGEGNAYLAGTTTYNQLGPSSFLAKQENATVTTWWTATSEAGPWSVGASISSVDGVQLTLRNGSDSIEIVTSDLITDGSLTIENVTLATGLNGITWSPSLTLVPRLSGTPETWHTITLDSGWTALAGFDAPRYRILPDGNLQLSGAASRTAFTANTNLNNSNPLPTIYRPAETHHYKGVDNLSVSTVRAGAQISSGGVIEALTAGTSCTVIEIDAIIPLN